MFKAYYGHMTFFFLALFLCVFLISFSVAQQEEEDYEEITSMDCTECHESIKHDITIVEDLSHSVHAELGCQDCHLDKKVFPHEEMPGFKVGCRGCASCHEDTASEYMFHGRMSTDECKDIPICANCHGAHDVLSPLDPNAGTNSASLPETCAKCHEDLDLTRKYQILIDRPIEIYKNSVHGQATQRGVEQAASCNDCHSTGGSAHRILSPGNSDSTINHFNIPKTCGNCHKDIANDYWQSIHGLLVARGETDSPVCTDCHGEHGIIAPSDPRSPVSKSRLSEATCSRCHDSAILTEKYGLPLGHLTSFVDSFHGLKSKMGDYFVANCASCHGVHMILSSMDPNSRIHPDNLQNTCGECHPGISAALAATPIHGIGGRGLHTKAARVVRTIYIVAIFVIIGLMVFYCIADLIRQLIQVMKKPHVRRMSYGELLQHYLLMISFIVLVISGFTLRYSDSWLAKIFFGWERGFEMRGIIHRIAALVLVFVTIWHLIYLLSRKGRAFFKDIRPKPHDFRDFGQQTLFNLGLSKTSPTFKRFSYVEKAEYWALFWGIVVMILTGILLWFDNFFVQHLPKGFLDVALVIHYYEAILATLTVFIWHLYATIFNPKIYPMNPSWLTGKMPKDMYEQDHSAVHDKKS